MMDQHQESQPDPPIVSEIDTLREALAAAERRAATLAELTALMSEGRNPLALAQRAVELTARATRSAGAFVYLWDYDEERLVLRVATDGWQRAHLDEVKLRVGEGVTGWAALMRQTVVLPKDPQRDPRFKPFPELRESSFKSMVAVPIVAPGEDVLGVFSLYALKKDGFSTNDVNLAIEVGSLLASGLVQAETLSQLKIQSAAAQFLRDVPDQAWGSLRGCLQAMATQCAADLQADVCLVEVTTDHTQPHSGAHAVAMAHQFRDQHGADLDDNDIDRSRLASLLAPLALQRLRIPLGAAAPIGAITCYRRRRFTAADEHLLEGIGAQVAAGALSLYGNERARPVVNQLLTSPDANATEQILKRHGWQSKNSWAAVIRIATTSTDLPTPDHDRVHTALQDVFGPHDGDFLLLGGNGRYLVLADGAAPERRQLLARRLEDVGGSPNVQVTAGIGPTAGDMTELHRAIRHALMCSHWAELISPDEGSIVCYEDIAHLRLLPSTALSMSSALRSLVDSLSTVVRYDIDNGAQLAQTLDSFLTNSSSVAKSSAELFIHRNTLRQRMQRIEEIIGQAPEKFDDWVTAGLAVRLIRESENEIQRQPGSRGLRCPRGVLTIGQSCCELPNACVLAPPTAKGPRRAY
ncbi:GAF domain-containing protein [Streptomyces sp. SID8361]|uniref:helix-turn-helix domain-containing protein n=1 Tax=Streptomyces sp. MnatMP-M27 TaxID=1839768 RepID=UPI00081D7409|nr:GAF domain-containing protein [Streptomyces sp. MnatMP-M27]MYU11081.1 GAF domain-containing protein [Streptomyces sp. SID8361]SCF78126.1 GAF domain-containing protein [Streptomyces sp. MnatMP-M27]